MNFLTKPSLTNRVLYFGSAMHVWNDLFFALLIPLLPLIKEDMNLSFTEVGLLRSVLNGASALPQVPAGFLAEAVGEFWPIVCGNIWVAMGLVAMALTPVFVILLAVSFLGGLGGGAQHPLASSMVSRAYANRSLSTALGTVNFAGDLGKMAAPILASAIGVSYGWRTTFRSVGVSGIVFMLLALFARKTVDIGKPIKETSNHQDGPGNSIHMGGFVSLSSVGFLDSATRGAALVFLPFVMDSKGMTATQLSAMLFLLFAGGATGKLIVGWLGERHKAVSLIWGTKALTALLLLLSLVAPPLVLAPLVVLLGIGLNGTSSVLYAAVAEFVPPHRRARFYGVYYSTNESGTVLAPILYGLIADLASLKIAMVIMSLATAAILPTSLTLRKYLAEKVVLPSATNK